MHIYTKEILKGKKKHACFQQAVSYSNINNDIPEPLEQLYLFRALFIVCTLEEPLQKDEWIPAFAASLLPMPQALDLPEEKAEN